MHSRDLVARFDHGAELIQRLTEERLGLLRIAHQSGLAHAQLEDWEDLGKAEQSVRQEYAERYLFELLQNANDAIKDWIDLHPDRHKDAGRCVRWPGRGDTEQKGGDQEADNAGAPSLQFSNGVQ